MNGGIVAMVCAPLMHGAGQWGTLISMHQGGKVLYSPRPETLDAHAILELCEREKAINLQITGDAFAIPLVKAMREKTLRPELAVRRSLRRRSHSPTRSALRSTSSCRT